MRTLMISAAVLALTTGLAAANPGVAQLAAQAGVSANDYTQAQLIQLLDAQRENDIDGIRFIMAQAGKGAVTRSDMGAGAVSNDAQLAAAAGVAPGQFTANELQILIEAKRDNDSRQVDFILSGQNRAEARPAAVVTPGKAQLAALLGVDASQYTLNELIALSAAQSDDNS